MGTHLSLKEKLDSYFWTEVCRPKWQHRDNLKKFVKILCEILDCEPCDIHLCYSQRRDKCTANNGGKSKCGGACYNIAEKCIYYIDDIDWGLILEELFHHINSTNNHKAMNKIMSRWYNSLTEKKNISKFFKKEKK